MLNNMETGLIKPVQIHTNPIHLRVLVYKIHLLVSFVFTFMLNNVVPVSPYICSVYIASNRVFRSTRTAGAY